MTSLVGQDIGRYHIMEQLGQGGMATVYKAFDTRLERDVAVKVIRREAFSPEMVERIFKRFEREAKALAKLTHPNIVGIYDYGEFEGNPYLVMQFVQGGTLKERLGVPVPPADAAALLAPVAAALAYAHGREIVHRDVKPANILITDNGDVMLSDFGIAKLLDMDEGNTLTGTNVGVGTPEYMAPEQVLGKVVDGRADIYSLGIVFFEMITGAKPYQADTPMAVVIKHINNPLPDPRQYVTGLSKDAEKLIYKALAKQPENRYRSMDEMAAAFDKLALGKGVKPFVLSKSSTQQTGKEAATSEDMLMVQKTEKPFPPKRAGGEKKPLQWIWILVGALGLLVIALMAGINRPWEQKPAFPPKTTQTLSSLPQAGTASSPSAAAAAPQATLAETITASAQPPVTSTSPIPKDMKLVFEEDFESGAMNGFNIIYGNWSVIEDSAGNMILEQNMTKKSNTYWPEVRYGPSIFTDGIIEFKIKWIEYKDDEASRIQMVFRQQEDIFKRYFLLLQPDGDLGFMYQLSKWYEPESTWGKKQVNIQKDQWYDIRMVINGTMMEAYVDGTLVNKVKDTRVTSGLLGITAWADSIVQFDDIKVYTP